MTYGKRIPNFSRPSRKENPDLLDSALSEPIPSTDRQDDPAGMGNFRETERLGNVLRALYDFSEARGIEGPTAL
jgi:hypothetical protein